ncbi:MAG TPA: flagellar hook-length control protein FliK [Devosia sp.]|nr:flagellar hook-length control protein FliK [Devosia sp.]
MTSHLSVSPVSASAAAPASSQPASDAGALGAFGAMLDDVQSDGPRSGFSRAGDTASVGGTTDTAGALQRLFGNGNAGQKASGFSVPLEATEGTGTDAPATADGTPPQLLKNLVAALGELDKAESAGGPVDDKLLKKVKDAVDAIATYLSGQPQLAAPATAGDADATSPAATATSQSAKDAAALAQARSSLASLANKLGTLSAGLGKDQADLAGKLDALAKQLDPKALSKATLGDLGLAGDGTSLPDGKLAAAINALANGKQQSSTAGQPKLADPSLKLPDGTALGAKAGHDATQTDAAAQHKATQPDPAQRLASAGDPAGSQDSAGDAKGSGKTTSEGAGRSDGAKAKDEASDIAGAVRQATGQPADGASPANGAGTSFATALNTAGAPAATNAGTAASSALQAQSAYQSAPINLPQMAVAIAHHAQQGGDHFQIRLDPPEMGRVDVKLAIDSSGTVNAHLTVERSETLDFLKRDQANLQQALQQAGLDAGKTNLQFSLGQNPFAGQQGGADPNAGNYNYGSQDEPDAADPVAAVTATTLYRGTASSGGLNLIV